MAITLQFITSLNAISAPEWDSLFPTDYPFTRYAFLMALEQGESIGGNSGWHSQHLTLWQDEQLIAAVPGYIKSHSYGEYLFDWQIAQAYEQYRLPFYPKWIAAIPFTPVTGPRLGVRDESLLPTLLPIISQYLISALTSKQLSCVQWLYPEFLTCQTLVEQGFWLRHDVQFLWQNQGYQQFSDFLTGLTSRKRKQILKERSSCQHLVLKTLTGLELTPQHWQQIIKCYQATYLKRSGHTGYISDNSFHLMAKHMADQLVVFAACTAEQPDTIVAASLCFSSNNTLYGRYWGAIAENELLHFELCYYQGIEYCIKHGLQYFDAGAQGEHKLKRGFAPVLRYGAYAFAATPLAGAIKNYFTQETEHLTAYIAAAKQALPYKD
ncbi:GNAT family N-acetyltransferase [Alishewanella sp. d11]|uniref:GNAT family N-acetyltransferase n=1 Tax=Alishewanella sp. d11 TaxID=3414030 RepID=UPI003BF808CE